MASLADRRTVARRALDLYTSPSRHYAFGTYDDLLGRDDELTAADVLMANLLNLRLSASEVVPLFASGTTNETALRTALDRALIALRDVRPFEEFSSFDELEEALVSLADANEAAILVHRWTYVTVSKVLHRRRPHIVPLIDSRVRDFYRAKGPQAVRRAMFEDVQANRDWLEPLARSYATPDGRPMTVLRAVDIVIWMPPDR